MKERETLNYNNNETYIKTNKDDMNSLDNLGKRNMNDIQIENNDNENNILNDNNNYFNNNYNIFSPLNMASMYMMGGQNTFFDKLFMTLERANYQMFHLCEMIKFI